MIKPRVEFNFVSADKIKLKLNSLFIAKKNIKRNKKNITKI